MVSPTFEPDLGGDYRIRLTVGAEGLSNFIETTFTVPTFDVAYLNVAGDNSSYTRAGAMVKSDGQSARNIGCYFSNSATSEASWISQFKSEGQLSFRAYYPTDTDSPTLLAYTYTDDSTGTMLTQIAGSANDCTGNPPVSTMGGDLPAFSPNGQRIAMVVPNASDAGGSMSIYTVGVDGKDPHIIRTSNLGSFSISWVNNTHITWIETQSRTTPTFASWSVVYLSADVEDAFNNNLLTSKILDCESATNPIDVSGRAWIYDGAMYLSEPYDGDPEAGTIVGATVLKLWRLEAVNGVYLCDSTAIQNKILVPDGTNNFSGMSDSVAGGANDFELSPDGTKIVLYARDTASGTEIQPTKILVGPSDGSAPFTALVAADGATNIAPHWVAGGRQVIWTKIIQEAVTVDASTYDRPTTSSIWIINADGTNARQLVTVSSTPSQARAVHTGGYGGFNCALRGSVSGYRSPFSLGTVALGLLVLRRGRRGQSEAANQHTKSQRDSGES